MNAFTVIAATVLLAAGLPISAKAVALPLNSMGANAPVEGQRYGQQSDLAATPAYVQSFTTPSNVVVETITWWGFYTDDPAGADFDAFSVSLGGVTQTGTLTVRQVTGIASYYEFTLDISDAPLTASTLSVANTNEDVEWFWQSTPAVGGSGAPDATAVSFSLNGRLPGSNGVPEPATIALLLLALTGLRQGRRRTD